MSSAAETNHLALTDPVDLTNCAREPIHIPGSIQPHGVLFAFGAEDLRVEQVSRNSEPHLGRAPEALLDEALGAVVGDAVAGQIRDAFTLDDPREVNPLRLELEIGGELRLFDALLNRCDGVPILELEPLDPRTAGSTWAFYHRVRRGLARLQEASGLPELYRIIADQVRLLTGFDRVMVYRFDTEWNGQVVGESRAEQMEPFLGLHFPASDIPRQARELYRRSRLRLIPNVSYQPVPLIPSPHPGTGRPLDLSLSTLRSVSPVHLEYLRNMDVDASMSISLLRGEELWGLIACHHNSPRWVPFEARTACELLGQAFATQLGIVAESEDRGYRLEVASVLPRLLERTIGGGNWIRGLASDPADLLAVTRAAGAAIVTSDGTESLGDTPNPEQIEALVEWLEKQELDEELFVTDRLASFLDSAVDAADFPAGLVAARISRDPPRWILWFRPEVVQTVSWAGDPRKPVRVSEDGEQRLSPRGSFAEWQETVRGRSRPWHPGEIAAAGQLRQLLLESVLRQEIETLNEELQRSNEELDSFAYIASHDLKEPLRGIHNYSAMLSEDYAGQFDREGQQRLETLMRLTQRMETLLESLMYYSRVGRLELRIRPVDLQVVLDEVLEGLALRIQETGAEIRVPHPLPTVPCDRVRAGEVFHNLIGNALKYNDKADPWVEVGFRDEPDAPVVFYVRDNGIGIKPRHQETVFRIFKRLHARDAYGGGTGAGLTIVQRIVERHGGRIRFESEPGTGTTFFFALTEDARVHTNP